MIKQHIPVTALVTFLSLSATYVSMAGQSYLSKPRLVFPAMNFSRDQINADLVLPGDKHKEDIIPYTGKGVIIGVVDGGIDPHHVTFMDSQQEYSRVKRFILTESAAESDDKELKLHIYSDDEVADAPADNYCNGHGTHTSSIAAGAWLGNDFYGVARDAELVLVSMGDLLYDDEIIGGMNAICDYALQQGKPCVMNFSLGSYIGPHDGTSEFSLAAKEVSDKGPIIVTSAGNAGQMRISILRDFSKIPDPLYTAFYKYNKGDGESIYLDIRSADTKSVQLAFVVITNPYPAELIYKTDFINLDEIEGDGVTILDTDNPEASLLPELAEYFTGKIELEKGIYEANGKYHVILYAGLPSWSSSNSPRLGVGVKSDAGANVRIYSESTNTLGSGAIDGFTSGTTKETISDLAVGDGVIGVGSTNTARGEYTNLDGETFYFADKGWGDAGDFTLPSSRGTSFDDKMEVLPQVLAPGTYIMAAVNGNVADNLSSRVLKQTYNGEDYYWGEYSGTSMSSPAVAGVIALWLEANPSLTRDDIINVLAHTSKRQDIMERYGDVAAYGEIDAYEGLKYILNNMGIGNYGSMDLPKLMVRFLADNNIECVVSDGGAKGMAQLISMDGKIYELGYVNDTVFNLTLPDVKGIYILSIPTSKGCISQKLVLN